MLQMKHTMSALIIKRILLCVRDRSCSLWSSCVSLVRVAQGGFFSESDIPDRPTELPAVAASPCLVPVFFFGRRRHQTGVISGLLHGSYIPAMGRVVSG